MLDVATATGLALVTGTVLFTVVLAVLADTAELRKMNKATQETLQAETLEVETVEVVNNDKYSRG
jgi:hypothetical protein